MGTHPSISKDEHMPRQTSLPFADFLIPSPAEMAQSRPSSQGDVDFTFLHTLSFLVPPESAAKPKCAARL